eukprot:TRINITY_DN4548_c0_g1_i7.p1 TRINITY_DN4548_c0_g1~~TRINITY_DN4548_c0_g1_i7.p1  ORF type:complete len:484 (+),score=70.00 TRINITY_DN4548_c0_g1_i7:893-2344(+)
MSLELTGIQSLPEALSKFFQADILDGQNKYKCERGCGLVRAAKKFSILVQPRSLVIQLKRFNAFDPRAQFFGGSKISRHIAFDSLLELSPYMSPEVTAFPRPPTTSYSLRAVIVHQGSSVSVGHYVAYVRARPKEWFLVDDDQVYPVQFSEVKKQQAYMLFYSMYQQSPQKPNTVANPLPSTQTQGSAPIPMVYTNPNQSSNRVDTRPSGFIMNSSHHSSSDSTSEAIIPRLPTAPTQSHPLQIKFRIPLKRTLEPELGPQPIALTTNTSAPTSFIKNLQHPNRPFFESSEDSLHTLNDHTAHDKPEPPAKPTLTSLVPEYGDGKEDDDFDAQSPSPPKKGHQSPMHEFSFNRGRTIMNPESISSSTREVVCPQHPGNCTSNAKRDISETKHKKLKDDDFDWNRLDSAQKMRSKTMFLSKLSNSEWESRLKLKIHECIAKGTQPSIELAELQCFSQPESLTPQLLKELEELSRSFIFGNNSKF